MEPIEQLAKLNADREELLEQREIAVRAVMPECLRQQLDDVAVAYDQRLENLDKERMSLEKYVRSLVLEQEETMRGAKLLAVYQGGKTSWDSEALDEYATTHPEILEFRKQGKPFVVIRAR